MKYPLFVLLILLLTRVALGATPYDNILKGDEAYGSTNAAAVQTYGGGSTSTTATTSATSTTSGYTTPSGVTNKIDSSSPSTATTSTSSTTFSCTDPKVFSVLGGNAGACLCHTSPQFNTKPGDLELCLEAAGAPEVQGVASTVQATLTAAAQAQAQAKARGATQGTTTTSQTSQDAQDQAQLMALLQQFQAPPPQQPQGMDPYLLLQLLSLTTGASEPEATPTP